MEFDFETYMQEFISKEDLNVYNYDINQLKAYLNKDKPMMGWYDLDTLFDESLIKEIEQTADYIRNNCDVFLVLGIGGSYLGALTVIEALNPYFYNQVKKPEIYFIGTNLSADYYHDLIEIIKDKEIIVNVISKSGTTLEVSIAYQLIMNLMKEKYAENELKKRLIITTDVVKGKLREEVNKYGYKSFIVPDNIGGRYSVFTPVGLLPIAVSNINIRQLGFGAKQASLNLNNPIKYAVIRDMMAKKGKLVEAYTVYEPKLYALTEWLKQLYAESLGKEGKGTLPISLINTRDLHSLGQFIQQGSKILLETVINVKEPQNDTLIGTYNKTLSQINNIAMHATIKAHNQGQVPNNIISLPILNEVNMGYLLQFFMISCALNGYLMGVNPFDQPGVEDYKRIINETL
ncbi:MAG: glucose-6-phosphate isomerase [Bacilli bacterium]|nr:glucose-6-phosphate isomerase [Bacilli bacterium]